jgi:hypothetical protein
LFGHSLVFNEKSSFTSQRGFVTPEKSSLLAPSRRGSHSHNDFEKSIPKVQSLDFKSKYGSLVDQPITPLLKTQKEQSQKAMEAKAYRQKLLEKQGGDNLGTGSQKEKAQRKKKHEEFSMDSKATFAQCVFNMANILMVSRMKFDC